MKVAVLVDALMRFDGNLQVRAFDMEYGDLVPVTDVTQVGDYIEIQTENPDEDGEDDDSDG